jgi:hypothetical protein
MAHSLDERLLAGVQLPRAFDRFALRRQNVGSPHDLFKTAR